MNINKKNREYNGIMIPHLYFMLISLIINI